MSTFQDNVVVCKNFGATVWKTYTANVLSVEIADFYLQSQSKNKHFFILQIFSCCYQIELIAEFTEKF